MSRPRPTNNLIPNLEDKAKTNTSFSIRLKSNTEASELFSMAKNRLLDVSNWDKICGPVPGKFRLIDQDGNEIQGLAIAGDYLKIDLPDTKAATATNWVRIEAIDEECPAADCDEIAIRVRPAQSPGNEDHQLTQFFKKLAHSTFRIKREKNTVIAEVHGRNVLASLYPGKPLHKMRNALLGVAKMLGISPTLWRQLVKGLLSLKKLR